jgi:hypothetical protein
LQVLLGVRGWDRALAGIRALPSGGRRHQPEG